MALTCGRRVASLLVVLVALTVAAGAHPQTVAAGTVDVGTPRVEVTFGEGIRVSGPVTTSSVIERAELLLEFPGALGPLVIDVSPERRTGALQLQYTLDATDGQITPNTRLSARFRVTTVDGAAVLGSPVAVVYTDDRFPWRIRTDELVRLHWYEGNDAFADRALGIASNGLRAAEDFLGVSESQPVDVFVYASEDDIYEALAPDRENVGGQAYPDIRTLFALITPAEVDDPWVGVVIPHEITHLAFDTAVASDYDHPPKWLDEGVAVYLSEGYTAGHRGSVDDAVDEGALIPLAGLVGQFPTSADRFGLAYAESVSAVDYLARTYGRSALQDLIAAYGDGAGDDEAFAAAIGSSPEAFDAAWRADVGASPPVVYGPQPGEPGPLPADWVDGGPGATAVPTSPAEPAQAPGLTDGGLALVAVSVLIAAAAIGGLVVVLRRRPGGTVA